MAKKKFASPFILLVEDEGDPTHEYHASAQGGLGQDDEIFDPIDYWSWASLYGADLVEPEGIDWYDYKTWMEQHNMGDKLDPDYDPDV